ncbi:nuclear transport factor 2 family protein [Yinghuangia sp. YIM S09857]|uniref:nuclear transport factor 2 family protein n=1 Tax=Yinghuangia sp. YIM S09857 TaxID=3436929 RepID=UPI003F536AE2
MEGPETVGAFIGRAIERFDHFQFVSLGTRMALRDKGDDAAATARMYMSEIRHDKDSGRQSTVYGVYHDRFQRVDGCWRFADRRYHSLARTGPDIDAFPFPRPDQLAPPGVTPSGPRPFDRPLAENADAKHRQPHRRRPCLLGGRLCENCTLVYRTKRSYRCRTNRPAPSSR